jgi:hypothetical protein
MRKAAYDAGHADLLRLVENSECGALLPHKMLSGVHAFAKAQKSLFEVAQEALPHIQSLDDLQNLPWKGLPVNTTPERF